jgi:hypothetical protein
MAKYKSLLISPEVVTAGRLRKCYHNPDHSISKGEVCLEVREGLGHKGYCAECALEMIRLAGEKLKELSKDLK